MQADLSVFRLNPTTDTAPRYDPFQVTELPEYATVLDALIKVRDDMDGSLALRCSCRSAVCGSCGMRVNGEAKLTCKTKLADMLKDGEEIVVEPMGYPANQETMPIIKDLVVDMTAFWNKVGAVKPWVEPEGERPEREHLLTQDSMVELQQSMNCIMCGACVSDCTVLEVDKGFLGPAALAKAYRAVGDPRDGRGRERLRDLSEKTGVWDCTHCFECVQVCPKDVAPMDQILKLRKLAMDEGFTDNNGARHSEAAVGFIEHSGKLDELRFIPKTHKIPPFGFNIAEAIRQMPGAIRMALKGKMPPLFHKPIPGIEHVKSLFKKVEEKEKTAPKTPKCGC